MHTLLSVLGIIIGVAALVAILSLIDGMEEFAKKQVSQTTSLQTLVITVNETKMVNGVRIQKDTFSTMSFEKIRQLQKDIDIPFTASMYIRHKDEIKLPQTDSVVASHILGVSNPGKIYKSVVSGDDLTVEKIDSGQAIMLVNQALSKLLITKSGEEDELGLKVEAFGKVYSVAGIIESVTMEQVPQAFIPITTFPRDLASSLQRGAYADANSIEDVPALKSEIENWLGQNFQNSEDDFSVRTNEFRVDQINKGMFLFRIIMGLITGISVLVGGIGVMNVLLISVTERTREIGIRKASGARKRDIVFQFLSESIAVSVFGSSLGLILGIAGTAAIVPIVKAITDMPFQAAYTLNTMLVIGVIAILIGIVFGTYPAMRAARLDPVDAIRHE